jgi:HD-GYP domain-containing protein (c-di-GMP phosphodiesterase class II)
MRRRVLYDATSRAAAAAAELLRPDFDVVALSPATEQTADDPAVVLIGADARDGLAANPSRRVLALVDAQAPGPWPTDWFALLPAGAGGPILARAVQGAFEDLERTAALARLERELSELNAIGVRLSAERNPRELLVTIMTKAREITQSDAGSLYLVEEDSGGIRRLRFALAQNDSVSIPYRTSRLPLTSASVAGHVALTGETMNLEDAYAPPPGAPFRINRSFDDRARYHTKSMLVVPMHTPQGDTIGVLQLINCKPDYAHRFRSVNEIRRMVRPYSPRHARLAESLASQAAVAIHNSRLFESINRLFDGFVHASVTAIESRDPTTSGHSLRVANYTVGLAIAVDRCTTGVYGATHFSTDELKELRYAALLHDFGKVGVREQVLVKAKKLFPIELDRIRQRGELIKRGLALRYADKKIEHLFDRGQRGYKERAAALDAELAAYVAEIDDSLSRVVTANEPTVLPKAFAAELEQLARRFFEDHVGRRHTVITQDEAKILSIARGSLTEAEFKEIQSHVVHTYQFLSRIPWTREFRRIPEIARSHHEKLDGTGYPYGMKADEIPIQSKMMTIADIYDALTAGDRPYKKGLPRDEALDMLSRERRAGHLDGGLLDLFVEAKIYEAASSSPIVTPPATDRRRPRR